MSKLYIKNYLKKITKQIFIKYYIMKIYYLYIILLLLNYLILKIYE